MTKRSEYKQEVINNGNDKCACHSLLIRLFLLFTVCSLFLCYRFTCTPCPSLSSRRRDDRPIWALALPGEVGGATPPSIIKENIYTEVISLTVR